MVAKTELSETQRQDVLTRARDGATLKSIAESLGIDRHTLYHYLDRNPEFEAALERAMVKGAYAFLDDMRTALVENLCNGDDALIGRVKLEAARFWLEKRFPREFSPKQQIDVRHVIDLAPSIERARLRVMDDVSNRQVIDAPYKLVTRGTDKVSVEPSKSEPTLLEMLK